MSNNNNNNNNNNKSLKLTQKNIECWTKQEKELTHLV